MAKPMKSHVADLAARQALATAELVAGIEAARSTLRDIDARRRTITSAPVDPATLRANISAYLQSEERSARQEWHNPFADAGFAPARTGVRIGNTFGRHPVGVLCVLGFGDQMADSLEADALANLNGEPMTDGQREQALGEADADYLRTEILIERLIRTGESAGIEIARDEDARPEIYLAKELPDV